MLIGDNRSVTWVERPEFKSELERLADVEPKERDELQWLIGYEKKFVGALGLIGNNIKQEEIVAVLATHLTPSTDITSAE